MAKGSAPQPPDYSPIAQSSSEAARIQGEVSREQLDWAKQQYADQAPQTKAFMDKMLLASDQSRAAQDEQLANARKAQGFYESTYQPIEARLASEAQAYASPQRAAQQSAMAQGDVSAAFSGQRNAALQTLEGYNIDPSQTRYGALDLGARISQAAAQASAGTQSRLQTEAVGRGLETAAVNVGRGYPGQVTTEYGGSVGAGTGAAGQGGAGINAGINTSNVYGSMMGNPTQWASAANASQATGISATNAGYQNQMAGFNANAAIAQNTSSGIGSMVGAAAGIGVMAIAV
jgi:hypothetical protein